MKNRKNITIHILLPLLAGVLVYILFRKPATPLHQFLGIHHALFNTRSFPFLLFQFPDGCWAYAMTASLLLFTSYSRWLVAAISLILLSLVEYQQAGWRIDLLDGPDLITMTIAVFLALSLIRKK